jgi:hypothetical protein
MSSSKVIVTESIDGVEGLPENKTLFGGILVINIPPEGIRIWVKESK